jgi:anthranilate synthase component 2/para-aminobenzoate synthetase component 2
MIVLIDNYDSFVFNLARFLQELEEDVLVVRNDEISVEDLEREKPSHIIISPGPCTPSEAGVSVSIVQHLGRVIPILGVCLGHQCIGQAFGGRVIRAARPMHGHLTQIQHPGTGLFTGLPSPLEVTRYHSLVIDSESPGLGVTITARTDEGEIMAIKHESQPVWGVQFHPEAVLTRGGHRLLANFLAEGRGDNPEAVSITAEPCSELSLG